MAKTNRKLDIHHREWARKIRKRDNFTCQMCNKKIRRVQAHHILPYSKYPLLRYDINNGISLCGKCHSSITRKEMLHASYLLSILERNKRKSMIILRDTREKKDYWNLSFGSVVKEQKVQTLKTGDYTIKGLEHIVTIERKKTTGELAINLGSKWKTFEKELMRMSKLKYKYIICEFNLSDIDIFPSNSGIPEELWSKIKIRPKFIMSRLNYIGSTYGIEILFCGDNNSAQIKAVEILTDVYNKEH